MKQNPLRAFCAAHPVLLGHAAAFLGAFALAYGLLHLVHVFFSADPQTLAAAEPIPLYLSGAAAVVPIIISVNKGLARPCRESTRILLFAYRIALIVLLLSVISYFVIHTMQHILAPLLPSL